MYHREDKSMKRCYPVWSKTQARFRWSTWVGTKVSYVDRKLLITNSCKRAPSSRNHRQPQTPHRTAGCLHWQTKTKDSNTFQWYFEEKISASKWCSEVNLKTIHVDFKLSNIALKNSQKLFIFHKGLSWMLTEGCVIQLSSCPRL